MPNNEGKHSRGRIVEEVERMEQSGMLKALDVLLVRRGSTGELETQPGATVVQQNRRRLG